MSCLYFAHVLEPRRERAWLKYGISKSDDPQHRLDAHARVVHGSRVTLLGTIPCEWNEAQWLERELKRLVRETQTHRPEMDEWIPLEPQDDPAQAVLWVLGNLDGIVSTFRMHVWQAERLAKRLHLRVAAPEPSEQRTRGFRAALERLSKKADWTPGGDA